MDSASTHSSNSLARRDLTRIYAGAVSAVAPAHLIGRALGGQLAGAEKVPVLMADASRIFLLAAGKAALGMATEIAARLEPRLHDALAIVPSGPQADDPERQAGTFSAPRDMIRIIVAAHPLPDASSQRAAEAALDLYRNGARVTLVHRAAELGKTIKYWVRPDIENRIRAGQVHALFETRVTRIERDCVWVQSKDGSEQRLPARQVFVLTGYHPDFTFLRAAGIQIDSRTGKPALNSQTLESNVPGIFLAGVVIGGNFPSEIFIENGRFHGKQIVAALTGKPLHVASVG